MNPISGRCNAGKPDDRERCERNPKTNRCRLRQKSKSRSRTHKKSKDRKHHRSSSHGKRSPERKKHRRSSSKHERLSSKGKRSLSKKHKKQKSKDKKRKTSKHKKQKSTDKKRKTSKAKSRSRSTSKPKTTSKRSRIAQRHALVFGGAGLPTIPICLTLAGRTSFRLGGERISRDNLKELFHRHGVQQKNMHLSLPKGRGCMVVIPDAVKEKDLPERFWKQLYKSNPEAVLIRVSDYFYHLSKFPTLSSRSRYL